MQANSWKRRTHKSFQQRSESLVASPSQRGSRRRHNDVVLFPEESAWDKYPAKQSSGTSEQRMISQSAYNDPNVGVPSAERGHAHHRSSRHRAILPGVEEASDGGRRQASHRDRHNVPVPPRAPRIPRLPTPDFDNEEFGGYDMTDYNFCSCCNAEGGAGCGRQECATAKMQRRRTSFPFDALIDLIRRRSFGSKADDFFFFSLRG
ncbi:hypothetical protein F4804DRAFT_49809 [Jackrogersella minutella]|nr:hypothetical protein F4804DRAFT_49809 [Jackrogersella minutella]